MSVEQFYPEEDQDDIIEDSDAMAALALATEELLHTPARQEEGPDEAPDEVEYVFLADEPPDEMGPETQAILEAIQTVSTGHETSSAGSGAPRVVPLTEEERQVAWARVVLAETEAEAQQQAEQEEAVLPITELRERRIGWTSAFPTARSTLFRRDRGTMWSADIASAVREFVPRLYRALSQYYTALVVAREWMGWEPDAPDPQASFGDACNMVDLAIERVGAILEELDDEAHTGLWRWCGGKPPGASDSLLPPDRGDDPTG